MSTTPRFGLIVIGDEILSGKRQDKHFAKAVELLGARGLELSWVRYAGDDEEVLTQLLRETFASGAKVFSCGGIGGTPDDRTRQCAAAAAGVPLAPHPDGMRELRARFREDELNPVRLRMVEFPVGSEIIPNPVNRIPGFSLREHYFMPGFPSMAWPMMEWVLDAYYSRYFAPGTITERVITVYDCPESRITPVMEAFVARYPRLRMSCLPNSDISRRQLELGFRGEPALVERAMAELQAEVSAMALRWEETPP